MEVCPGRSRRKEGTGREHSTCGMIYEGTTDGGGEKRLQGADGLTTLRVHSDREGERT